jgi:hypothetical protein
MKTLRQVALMFCVTMIAAGSPAQADAKDVTFTAEYGRPLLEPATLVEKLPSRLNASLKIVNDSHDALRFSRFRSLLPELLDVGGTVVPFDYGANGSRQVTAADYPLLAPGQSIVIPLVGTLILTNGHLNWKGDDSILGFWKVSLAHAPYRLRLHYRQEEATVGPISASSETLRGLWTGDIVTESSPLPLQ